MKNGKGDGKMRKILTGALAAGCLLLGGCGRAMESFAAWQPEISFEVGSSWQGEIPADDDGIRFSLEEITAAGFSASLEGNTLTLEGEAPGSFSVTISASGWWWEDTSVTLPVEVTPHEMALSWALAETGETPEGLTLTVGETAELTLSSDAPGVFYEPALGEGLAGTASLEGEALTFTAGESAGSGALEITARAENYADAVLSIPMEVLWGTASPGLPQAALTLEPGESRSLALSPTQGAEVALVSAEGIAAALEGDTLTLTAGESAGSARVTLSAAADQWLEGSQTLEITVAEPAPAAPPAPDLPQVDTSAYAADAAEIIRLTNEYRRENGLEPLEHLPTVDILATIRAREADESWSHTRPDGSGFEMVFTQYGITYRGYGENLFSVNASYTPEQVVEAWKDSPGHNENLLRPQFDGIGVGICKIGEYYYYCQLFTAS